MKANLESIKDLGNFEACRANKALNPSKWTVYYWFSEWRRNLYGERLQSYEALKKMQSPCEKEGIILRTQKDPLAVIIITPLMHRANQLESSKSVCFVDSTATCDAENHTITFILAQCSIGAIPLAILITENQTEEAYVAAFNLFKTTMGATSFGGRTFPHVFVTDDAPAEKNALAAVWPNSDRKNCIFHIAQAHWRWLWEGKNEILKEHRQPLMLDFRRIMYCTTEENAAIAYESAQRNATALGGEKYSKYLDRLEEYWLRKIDWVIAYRDHHSRGNFTNNFAEATVRIFKEKILRRCKTYNAAALVDHVCKEVDEYYRERLLDFAHCRDNSPFLKLEKVSSKIAWTKEQIQQIGDSYFVQSTQCETNYYQVTPDCGTCDCIDGQFGRFCKHAAAVFRWYPKASPNRPPVTVSDRHRMAVVALGNNAQPMAFYLAINETMENGEIDNGEIDNGEIDNGEIDNGEIDNGEIDNGEIDNGQIDENKIDDDEIDKFAKAFANEIRRQRGKPAVVSAFKRFATKFEVCVNVPNRLCTLLNSASTSVHIRTNSRAKIPTGPHAAARRKKFENRGNNQMPRGRPPLSKSHLASRKLLQKAKRTRRARDLAAAIRENRPNAKSHM